MRPENSEAFRQYLRSQPKAIAYSERLQAGQDMGDSWVMLVASALALAVFAANVLA